MVKDTLTTVLPCSRVSSLIMVPLVTLKTSMVLVPGVAPGRPNTGVAVIVTVPSATGLTTPALTVAMVSSLEVQVTDWLVAAAGLGSRGQVIVLPPTPRVPVVGLSTTEATLTPTVTIQEAA